MCKFSQGFMKKFSKNKNQSSNLHFIYGLNGAEQIFNSKKVEIVQIDVMKDSNTLRKGFINSSLKKYRGKVNNLPKDHFLKKYKGLRTQGIVIYFKGSLYSPMPQYTQVKKDVLLLALDNIEDPQNLGQILRTAECGGVDGIILPINNSVGLTQTSIQVSQGAFLNIPIYQCNNLKNEILRLKKEGFWSLALENGLNAKPWYDVDMTGKTIIVLGSEGKGIRPLVLKSCDFTSTIPMKGKTNSLNVSAAVSAIVFERLRQTLTQKS
jgi:23S rRNA (guanosine2251-2'-O)-methyltransferase